MDFRRHYVCADIVRIFAAWIVACFHLAYWSWTQPPSKSSAASVLLGATSFPEVIDLTFFGLVGVDIFFVLSGFVIAHTALRSTSIEFAQRRFMRLFPTALISATLTLSVAVLISWKDPGDLFNRFMRSAFLWPYGPYIDGQYWTLPIEISFYIFVFAILLTRQRSNLGAIIGGLGCLASLFLIAKNFLPLPGYLAHLDNIRLIKFGAHFALGTTFFFACAEGWNLPRAIVVLLCIAAIPLARPLLGPVHLAVFGLSMLVLYIGTRRELSSDLMFSSKTSDVIRTAALVTYPFYLLHDLIGTAVLRWEIIIGVPRYMALLLALAAMWLLSVGVFHAERYVRFSFTRQQPAPIS